MDLLYTLKILQIRSSVMNVKIKFKVMMLYKLLIKEVIPAAGEETFCVVYQLNVCKRETHFDNGH